MRSSTSNESPETAFDSVTITSMVPPPRAATYRFAANCCQPRVEVTHDERDASSESPAVNSRTTRHTLRPGVSLRIQPAAVYGAPAVVEVTGLVAVTIEKLEPPVRATRAAPEPTLPSDASGGCWAVR